MVGRNTALSLLTVCLGLAPLAAAPDKADSLAAARPDSVVQVVRRDSLLTPDSSFSDYFIRRERFNYPATSRQDPFNSPFGKNRTGEGLGPSLSDMELTGVLFSPDGASVAILGLPDGGSYILHEGDWLGVAEVSLIEKTRIHFRIREYGVLRTLVKDLKPLVEDNNGKSPEDAGSGGRQQQESRPADSESGGPPPRR
ncbi:hypothetical protein LLH00_06990 [bacterium]|nr:hypothetical protein [bacterium]